MKAQKDGDKGTWKIQFYYRDWQGANKKKYKRGFKTCVNICPVDALEHLELEQQACWDYAFGDDKTIQSWVISCHKCRDICPYNLGTENSFIKE